MAEKLALPGLRELPPVTSAPEPPAEEVRQAIAEAAGAPAPAASGAFPDDEYVVRTRDKIVVVGVGFVGSLFVEELAKRLYAFELENSYDIVLIDPDHVSKRNTANQWFPLAAEGHPKALVMENYLKQDWSLDALGVVERLDKTNKGLLLDSATLIVDAVDNLPTRTLLWYHGLEHKVPILHLGVAQAGVGVVEWTTPENDTWSLSPIALATRSKFEEVVPKELPPCELVGFRGLGLNIALAAVKALFISWGRDAEMEVGHTPERGTLTTWHAELHGHKMTEIWTPSEGNKVIL